MTITAEHHDGWPIYTLAPARGAAHGAFVYVHGGGWVNEIAPQHWRLAAQVAAEAKMTVTLPIYPLVPFGAAAEVVPRIVEIVAERSHIHAAVSVGGDSAGGQIILSAALAMRDQHRSAPTQIGLISPVLDCSMSNPVIAAIEPHDPWLSRAGIRVYVEHWSGELSINDPLVSPLSADFAGLAALTLFSGTRDLLNADACQS